MENGRVATTPFAQGVLIMFNIINALQGPKKEKEVISDPLSTNALPLEKSSNQLEVDLLKINELTPLFEEWTRGH